MKYNEIPRDETIACDDWLKLCDYEWDAGVPLRRGVVFCEPAKLAQFFAAAEGSKEPLVLVTAASDYSICEQHQHHPNTDILKLIKAAALSAFTPPTESYVSINPFQAPVDMEHSRATDRWSVKIDRFTKSTFSKVPDAVRHWYSSNLDADIPNTTWLPFGLAPSHDPKQTRDYFAGQGPCDWSRPQFLYLNFSDNTVERVNLKARYRNESQTYIEQVCLSAEEYVRAMQAATAVLSPFGNGLDCYRTSEAWYLGKVPVLKGCKMTAAFKVAGLPVFLAENLFDLDKQQILDYVATNPFEDADLSVLTKSYWRASLAVARKEHLA